MSVNKRNVGAIGERIAAKYLVNKGFFVLTTNYRKTYGEIDIVVKKGEKIHFIEVKSVSRETEKWGEEEYRPEENVHPWKMQRLANTIQAYLSSECGDGQDWQFDVVTVEIDFGKRKVRCKLLENVIL
jgi:putative endonuclease